tara:strand:- start:346 stop:549 length:204 start_codon:yes stop_codon:yes gene_type:complete
VGINDLDFTSTIPLYNILMSGNAKKGRNKGIRCGFLNLQPESDKTSLIFVKFFVTFSIGSVEIIPHN